MSNWLGITIRSGNRLGMVVGYHSNTDTYDVIFDGQSSRTSVDRTAVERDDREREPDLAEFIVSSNFRAGTLEFTTAGWDVVSYEDSSPDHDAYAITNPPQDDQPTDDELVWDPTSRTYVRRAEKNDADQSYSFPEAWGVDPAGATAKANGVTNVEAPKNPLMEGIYAGEATTPFPDVVPLPDIKHRDNSFPSATSKKAMNNYAHIADEEAARVSADANLLNCPECGDMMIDDPVRHSARCVSCGHSQNIINAATKEGLLEFLAPLLGGGGDVGAVAGAESGGLGSSLGPLSMVDDLMASAFNTKDPTSESKDKEDKTASSDEDNKNVGIGVDIRGIDVVPDAGNKGWTGDVGDDPANMRDVNDGGGTDSHDVEAEVDPEEVMKKVEVLMPRIKEFAEDPSKSAHDDPELMDLDDLLAKIFPDEYGEKKSSMVRVARRPKMCPFHTQLVDFSIALDNPHAALQSLGALMYGGSSCLGGHELTNKNGNPSKCRFKPEMIQPQYWADQEAAAEQRRLEREQQQALMQPEMVEQAPIQQDENTITIPAETLNDLKEDEIPSVDAIETAEDYDPEAYWEAPDANEYVQEENNVVQFPTQQVQPQVQQQLQVPQPLLVAAKKIAASLDPTNLASDVPEIPEQDTVAQSVAEPIDAAPNEEPSESRIKDDEGMPLKAGSVYDMFDGESAIPDQIKVTKVAPLFIEFEVMNGDHGFNFPARLHTHTITADNIQFKMHDGSPNAQGMPVGAEGNNDDNTHAEDASSVMDLSSGRSASTLDWLRDEETDAMVKEAGKHYSPSEQRGLIHETGSARNLDKLDLEGTHYPHVANLPDDDDGDSLLFYN